MSAPCLADLVRPLSAADFVRAHWLAERPFLSAPNPAFVEQARAIELLRDVELLLKKRTGQAVVFGPRQFRAEIPASEAANFLQHGYTLYLTHIEKTVPEVMALFEGIGAELGVPSSGMTVQLFIAEPDAVSSVHYDHDVNFQLLLEGEKEWSTAPNQHIRNPAAAYHPVLGRDGEDTAFHEEAFARDARVPTTMPAGATHFVATPGTVMFVPRGHWHEVRSRKRSVAVNLVLGGLSWGAVLSRALTHRMAADEQARAYVGGVLSEHEPLRANARAQFEAARARALKELTELTIEETLVGWRELSWCWRARAKDREIIDDGETFVLVIAGQTDEGLELDPAAVPFLRGLIALRRRFSWEHVLHLVGPALQTELPAHAVLNLLGSLVEEQLLQR